MNGQDRTATRHFFVSVWKKYQSGSALEPLEQMVSAVILQHPEYHGLLGRGSEALTEEFTPERGESNPFLHMGLHIALQEQVAMDRPAGIAGIYRQLCTDYADVHEAEHRMMECLGEAMWQAQRDSVLPDDQAYMDKLRRIHAR